MANTTTSNTTGLLSGLQGLGGATSQPYYGQQQMYSYPTIPAPTVSLEKEITVPIIDVTDPKGIFLRDKDGKLMHVSAERLYKALGMEW